MYESALVKEDKGTSNLKIIIRPKILINMLSFDYTNSVSDDTREILVNLIITEKHWSFKVKHRSATD